MIPNKSTERRLVLRVLEYWQALRGDRDFPAAAAFDDRVLGDDWAWSLVIGLGAGPDNAEFKHVGDNLRTPDWSAGADLLVKDCPRPSLLGAAVEYMPRVLDRQVPISIGSELNVAGTMILYRSILLPLSNDGTVIDGLLGAANFRPIGTNEGADTES
ncbi:hypothetical protein [Pelagibius sp. Alg239-R121]|uniref:hypothetical protein n=1 Tax=Pelagibius sp. Alg239-R121 TaxID=2993448 RepID=UPI0024A60E56|nr:hypothetical protein [Pelagibius sp. Alg239-R121]